MVVCQYFLQGRCRYGRNCRNEHAYNMNERNTRSDADNLSTSPAVQIAEQIVVAEKGGLWPLTCFAPFNGCPNLPGWEDVSPEELRWNLYEARANGNVNQCISQINQLYANAEKMKMALKQPTREILNMIADLVQNKIAVSSTDNTFGNAAIQNKSNPFESKSDFRFDQIGSQNMNAFGGSSSGNIFGGTSPNQNPFMGLQPSGQNVFSNVQPSNSNQNIFSNPNQNIFSNTPAQPSNTSQTNFANPQSSSAGLFSNPQATGANPNIFLAQQPGNQNVFLPTNASNVFPTSNAFPSNPSNQNIFAQKAESYPNVFGGAATSTYPPQSPRTGLFNPTHTDPGIFGGAKPTGIVMQSQVSHIDSSVYSKPENLTEEEKSSFAAPIFAFGKIPLKPPPQQYC